MLIIVGFKNQLELPDFYQLADTFVLPSGVGETWGLVVNEAMCFKLPVIVSHLVGCAEDLVEEGVNGYRFNLDHTEELTKKMNHLIQSTLLCQSMGISSQDKIKKYSYEKDVRALSEALNHV